MTAWIDFYEPICFIDELTEQDEEV